MNDSVAEKHAYRTGLRDGKIAAMEEIIRTHGTRLNNHDLRIRSLERTGYVVLGMVVLIQFWPHVEAFFAR